MKNILKFLPLLLLYVIVTLVFSSNEFNGDEGRYVMYATNLSKGYYSPIGKIYLWSGPGYPIVLLPFVLLDLPWMIAKFLNPLFLLGAILYFYYTLRLYLQERTAFLFAYVLGLYPPFCRFIFQLVTEQLTLFLICGFMFYFCKLHHDRNKFWPHLLIGSVFLGFLALTKIFFAYVILTGSILFLFMYLWQKKQVFGKSFVMFIFAILLCTPYLIYTYSLTGKAYYWGNSGGLSLYMSSSPYEGELGDISVLKLQGSENRREFFNELRRRKLTLVEKDEALKKRALENIINYPTKYLRNWAANVGRLLFNYPYSQDHQKLSTYFYIFPNMFLVVLSVLCIYPAYAGRKIIPFEIFALIAIGLISFSGSSLIFAEVRYFVPLVPIFMLWIAFILNNVIEIGIKQ